MSVPAEECFFNTLDDDELELFACWVYEYLREFVLRMPSEQASAYRQKITRLRELVRDKTPEEAQNILMQQHTPLLDAIPVMFEPQWPDTPYQAILPKDQRIKRLLDWLPDWLPNSTGYLLKDLLPCRMTEEVIDALAEQLRAGEFPIVGTEHVHSGVEYMLSQHALFSDYRLDTIYRRYVAAIIIDPTIGKAAFLRRAEALWRWVVGNEETREPGRPKDSWPAKNRPELRQLGAYRMVSVFGLSVEEAILEIIKRLGDDAYYTDARSFQRAVDAAEERLKKFLQPPELNAE
jgi:hypothetical protein